MRMRKVRWAVEYLETGKKLVAHPEQKKGSWKQEGQKLHLELGCGKGNYSLQMAKMYPDELFVAVEKNESAAGIALKKFDEEPVDNVLLIHGDASQILDWFESSEVDVLHLNFSDPWPKKRYAKRRLSSKSFLDAYRMVLDSQGEIQMKTDNEKLFEYSIMEFLQEGFSLVDFCVNYRREPHPEDAITEYEEKFINKQQPIYRCVFRKEVVE